MGAPEYCGTPGVLRAWVPEEVPAAIPSLASCSGI